MNKTPRGTGAGARAHQRAEDDHPAEHAQRTDEKHRVQYGDDLPMGGVLPGGARRLAFGPEWVGGEGQHRGD